MREREKKEGKKKIERESKEKKKIERRKNPYFIRES